MCTRAPLAAGGCARRAGPLTHVRSGIADNVRRSVQADVDAGRGTEDYLDALRVLRHIDRKLVKQTVMTSVYGVTFMGARDQILNRFKERKARRDGWKKRRRAPSSALANAWRARRLKSWRTARRRPHTRRAR